MKWRLCLLAVLTLIAVTVDTDADTDKSTRVIDAVSPDSFLAASGPAPKCT